MPDNNLRFSGWAAGALLLIVGLALSACISPIAPPASPVSQAPLPVSPPSPTISPSPSSLPDATTFKLTREVPYGTGGGTPLFLDIYQPDQPIARPTPAVIFIHGGGWSAGDKYPSQVSELARAGFFCVSINYRLSGVAPFPAAVEDCKCAVRWLRANAAKYKVDPDRIGAWGGSAGGHLTLMVAASDATAGLEGRGGWEGVSSRVQAACSFFGPSDFVNWAQTSPAFARMDNKFLGGKYARIPEVFARASPVTYVSPDDPPLIIFHGDQDQVVPYEQSVLMDAACRKAGLESTLVMVRGAGHGFVMQPNVPSFTPANPEITRMVTDFFRKHLLK